MNPSFTVYVDESGDEGFKLRGEKQSTKWFVLSAVVVRKKNDHLMVDTMRALRGKLKKRPNFTVHFRFLKHEQKVVASQVFSNGLPVRTVSVICDKKSLVNPEYLSQGYNLYFYSVRFLLERVSWLCRDTRKSGDGDGTARIVFSNRSGMSYDDLRNYLALLSQRPLDVSIDWSAIQHDDSHIITLPHSKMAGLQVVDIVASIVFSAFEPNYYGNREDRYLRQQLPVMYRRKGNLFGYGIKLWPKESAEVVEGGGCASYDWLK